MSEKADNVLRALYEKDTKTVLRVLETQDFSAREKQMLWMAILNNREPSLVHALAQSAFGPLPAQVLDTNPALRHTTAPHLLFLAQNPPLEHWQKEFDGWLQRGNYISAAVLVEVASSFNGLQVSTEQWDTLLHILAHQWSTTHEPEQWHVRSPQNYIIERTLGDPQRAEHFKKVVQTALDARRTHLNDNYGRDEEFAWLDQVESQLSQRWMMAHMPSGCAPSRSKL